MRFSIIVPTFDRPQRLRNCLAGIVSLDYPAKDFEVIIVDDGSAEPLDGIVAAVHPKMDVRICQQQNAGPARARNLGAKFANGELLAFLDDDCVPQPGWLRSLDRAASIHCGYLLGGATRNACRDNIFAETNHLLLSAVTEWFSKQNTGLDFFTSNNMLVPARDFHEIGGFDVSFRIPGAEDRDFCARWLDSGRRMIPVPDAQVDHYHPQTIRSFVNMHFRYGRGAARFHRRRGTSPSQFVFTGLNRRLLSAIGPKIGYVSGTGLIALAQLATCAGFCWEKPRLKREAG